MAADRSVALSARHVAATRSRTPGMVNGAIVLVLLLVIVPLTLHIAQNPPPAIAEFSPQVQKQITKAPTEQGSGAGQGQGSGPGGAFASPMPAPTPAVQPVDTSRVLHCVGDPPRQIEDPQSPPCVAYWNGDNGGATSKGVSKNTIYIANPPGLEADLQSFFNTRFELYDRQIEIVDGSKWFPENNPPPNNGYTPEADHAAAQQANSYQYQGGQGVFASMGTTSEAANDYADSLANYGIISASSGLAFSESYMASRAPYIWQYQMGWDNLQQLMGLWYCRQLAGHNAVHAQGVDGYTPPHNQMNQEPRSLGVIMTVESDMPISPDPLDQQLSSTCGVTPAYQRVVNNYMSSSSPPDRLQDVEMMKSKGVTSVMCFCESADLRSLADEASSQDWHPEWLINTYLNNDRNIIWNAFGPASDQKADAFGLTVLPMQVPSADQPAQWAVSSVDPGPGGQYKNALFQAGVEEQYRSLLLLVSGIQMAGPDLTPATFAAGLQAARFPNPHTPIMAGDVGFNGGNHGMTLTAAEIWWSNSAQSPFPDQSAGSWCYVNAGRRYSMQNPFPQGGDPYFGSNTCDTGLSH